MKSENIRRIASENGLDERNGWYEIDGIKVTNFIVTDVLVFREPTSNRDAFLDVALNVDGTECHAFIEATTGDFIGQILRQVFYAQVTKRAAKDRLNMVISSCAICQKDTVHMYFASDGICRFRDGRYVYAAGAEILGCNLTERVLCNPSLPSHKLAIDQGLAEEDALRSFLKIARCCPEAFIAFLYSLLCSLRSVLIPLGLTIFPQLYIVGEQGSGKSTLAERFCTLFNNEAGMTYAKHESSSTDKGLYACLGQYRDAVVLVDDLAIGSSASVQAERTKLIANILRFAANDNARITGRSNGENEQSCRAGVVFTGEIPLTAASDLTRTLTLRLEHKLTGGKAYDRTVAATVFRGWMLWLLPNLEMELEVLRPRIVNAHGTLDSRLIQTGALFCWCADLFLRYACEKGCIAEESYQHAYRAVKEKLLSLLQNQQDRANRASRSKLQGNLFWYVFEAYQSGYLRIVSKKKRLEGNRDCLLKGETLFVRSAALVEYIQSETPLSSITKSKLGKLLAERRIIPESAEKRSASAKLNGVRYLPIDLSALKAAAVRY